MSPRKIKGTGIKESVDKRLNKRPKAIVDYLKKHGNEMIKHIIVCRTPISGMFSKIGNILTAGDWNEQQSKLGYDDIYHLYVLVKLKSNTIRIEKNSRLEISDNTRLGEDYKFIDDIGITLIEFFDRIESNVGAEKMYRYDPFTNNCQIFVMDILTVVGKVDQDIIAFVKQNVRELVENEFLRNGAKYVTDLHGLFDHAIQGGRKKNMARKTA